MEAESLIQPHVRGIEPYEPPDWQSLAALAGIPRDQLIRLDANENAYGPSPRVAEALAGYEDHGLYPDYQPLQAAVARYAGVEPGNIVLGNGGDEIIDLVVRLFVAPGDGVIVCPPAFNMYLVCTHVHRGRDLSAPRRDDFSLDLAGIESLVADGMRDGGQDVPRPALLFVTSPGNPDGQAIPLDAIRRLLQLPLVVVVDEAYIEYGGESAVPLVAAHPNLVVIRTFSKWAGMAGLRLGYAVVAGEVASAMARVRPPYNVNTAAMIAGLATLEDLEGVQARIAQTVAERQRLETALAELPCIEPLTSQANFVFFRFDDRAGREVADALAEQGILVRSFSNPSLANAMRVTVGRPEQNDAFLTALQAVIKGEGAMRREQGSMSKTQGTMEAAEGAELRDSTGNALVGQPGTRRGRIERRTGETEVSVTLDLDGTGRYEADTGLGFLDHMLAQLAAHGLFDVVVRARGDLEVDEHHTIEDVAIGLGQALDEALGARRGIVRMGQAYAPLDEALAHVVVDLSGRPYAVIDVEFATPSIGAVGTDLIIHFLETLAFQARISLHARVLYGRNDHHKAEALFKALGRALDAATRLDPRRQGIPSTKGVL